MKLLLEFDDLNPHYQVNCIKEIEKLINLFPEIKLTFFTSALYEGVPLYSDKEWCNKINKYILSNNVRLAVHGLVHSPCEEFKHKNKDETLLALNIAEAIFKTSNLDYIKIFRGPHWGINEYTYESLIQLGYKSIYTHVDYINLVDKYKEIKSIFYNWNLKDDFTDIQNEIIIAHGHTHNVCGNGISESLNKIISFIEKYNPEFIFGDEI
jgi:predicted deacetylase